MGKSKVVGFDALYDQFNKLSDEARDICGKTLYPGAGIVADAVKAAIDTIPARDRNTRKGAPIRGITEVERAGLKEGFGVAKMQEADGSYNVALGFDGYNQDVTKKYPKGHANDMIARSVESGTSFLQKTPFIGPAVRAATAKAEAAMAAAFDREIQERTK